MEQGKITLQITWANGAVSKLEFANAKDAQWYIDGFMAGLNADHNPKQIDWLEVTRTEVFPTDKLGIGIQVKP